MGAGGPAWGKSDSTAFLHTIRGVLGKREAGHELRPGEIPSKTLSGKSKFTPRSGPSRHMPNSSRGLPVPWALPSGAHGLGLEQNSMSVYVFRRAGMEYTLILF